MRNQKGFIPIVLAIVISVIAVTMVGVSVYFKVENDKQAREMNTNQIVDSNVNSSSTCLEYKPLNCPTTSNPGYAYNKTNDGCDLDTGGCEKPYASLEACTKACTTRTIKDTEGIIKRTCGNVITYGGLNLESNDQAQSDCQTRGGIFNRCDSPCGSVLALCVMSCTLSNN